MEKIVVSCLESRIDENQSVYSRFLLGPFLSGHAVTVATALRRALLSEVKNIAITALHIQGVTHEFSTLVGIRESVLELSLNFQQIILSTQTRTRSVQVGYLHVQGPAIVHANDLKLPDGVECVNPTQYIATISTEGLLVVKFLIGEKKSFLKGNTSTLNNKKIKQAKAYSAQLSNSLLSHAEYDPPRLFLALRANRLPNEICTANLLSTSSRVGLSEHPKIGPVAGKNNALGGTTNEPLAILQEQTETAGSCRPPARSPSASKTPSKQGREAYTGPTGQPTLALRASRPAGPALTRAEREFAPAYVRETITVDPDSKVDKTGNPISDEFNSEICLRTIIPLDPIFTPVYQVNFGIERDDLSNQVRERVIMEVWTNGSIHPRQAVNEAALSIMSIFSKLRKSFQLDSHSLAIPANSTACSPSVSKSVGLARNSRLYQTKNIVKSKPLSSTASESQERFARVAQGRFVNFRKFGRGKLAQTRFDLTFPSGIGQTVRFGVLTEGKQRRGVSRSPFLLLPTADASAYLPSLPEQTAPAAGSAARQSRARPQRGLSKRAVSYTEQESDRARRANAGGRQPVRTPPAGERAAFSPLIPLKLKSFSSLGFVRSRHPVALFLQDFGKSHIRGQTFLLEQSFGLKTRFFKGHRTVLSKVKYILEDHTLKRTFLPSFKLVLGPYGAVLGEAEQRNSVPARSKKILSRLPGLNGAKPAVSPLFFTPAALLTEGEHAVRSCLPGKLKFANCAIAPFQGARARLRRARPYGPVLTFGEQGVLRLLALQAQWRKASTRAKRNRAGDRPVRPHWRKAPNLVRRSQVLRTQWPYGLIRAKRESVLTRPQGECAHWREAPNRPTGSLARSAYSRKARIRARARVRQTEWFGIGRQAKPKPILFLIKYRTFSFTRNALRVFGCNQEDSSFLLPVTKQLIRLKMARVLNSCLSLMSKRSEPIFISRVIEPQLRGGRSASLSKKLTATVVPLPSAPVAGAGQTESLTQAGTQNRSFFDRPGWHGLFCRARSPVGLIGASRILALRANPHGLSLCASRPVGPCSPKVSTREPVITTVEGLHRVDVKQLLLSLAQSTSTSAYLQVLRTQSRKALVLTGASHPCSPSASKALRASECSPSVSKALRAYWPYGPTRALRSLAQSAYSRKARIRASVRAHSPAGLTRPTGECVRERGSAGFRSFTTDPVDGSVVNDLEFSGAQKRFASSIPLCGLASLGKIWLRSNLKKQFGFIQFAYNTLRADSQRDLSIGHTFFTGQAGRQRDLLLTPLAGDTCLSRGVEFVSKVVSADGPTHWRFAPTGPTGSMAQSAYSRKTRPRWRPVRAGWEERLLPERSSGWCQRHLERLGVCVNNTAPAAVSAQARLTQASCSPQVIAPVANKSKSYARLFRTQAAEPISQTPFEFTIFPLIMTKVPPLSLPSGLVTLLSCPSQDRADSRYRPLAQHISKLNARLARRRRGLAKFSKPDGDRVLARLAPIRQSMHKPAALRVALCGSNPVGSCLAPFGGVLGKAEQRNPVPATKVAAPAAGCSPKVSKNRSCSTANLFGFNSDASKRLEPLVGDSCFQLTTQERLSSLYSSNLDKMSFLSSDLANLSLSLKTYTFLKKKGKTNIASLLDDSPNTLFSLLNGNEKMFHEIERCLIFLGLPFKERS